MPQHDMIAPEWIRLKKPDGHLGALYHPLKHVLRFISRDGTVDYNLASFDESRQRKTEQAGEPKP
jgi:hypothetical protein